MPSLSSTTATVLVTGANGFIATWVVGELLKQGYDVRAAVRSEAKGQRLLKLYESYGKKLTIIAVGDMREATAFNEAVQDVDGIIHTASPLLAPEVLQSMDPKEVAHAAVGGVLGILSSSLNAGPRLQRVVFVSSCATIGVHSPVPVTLSEKDWNDAPVQECEEKGSDADGLAKYFASKVLAEKAAWKFMEDHKAQVAWDMSVILPPWVFGPSIHADITSLDMAPPSTQLLYGAIVKEQFLGYEPLQGPGHGFIDCRDLSTLLVRALETPAAGGERIIASAGSPWVWQEFLDVANSLSPSPYSKPVGQGTPGKSAGAITFDTSKEKRLFGVAFRTLEETCKDMLAEFEEKGF